MITSKRLRFGMIGAGAIAQAYTQVLQDNRKAELVAVADLREEAVNAIASTLKCAGFTDYRRMMDETTLDAVIVCTPPVTHPEICIALLRREIPTLCEKPLAIDSRSAQEVVRTARDNDTLFTMASKFRYVDDVIRAKSIVESGLLGEIILFENTFTARVDMTSRWNSDPEISGGGVLIDNGTHSVDIMRYFLGPLSELQVVEGKRIQALSVEDTVRLHVRTESGTMGNIDLSWSFHKPLPHFISVYGSNGTVQVGWKHSSYRRTSDDDWIVFGTGYDKVEAFTSQIDNFASAIRGEQALLISPTDALASVEVIEAAYQALEKGRWVPVPRDANIGSLT